MEMYAGVDGGGTRTRAVLYAVHSNRAVMVDAGPSRFTLLGPDACTKILIELLERGAKQCGGTLSDLVSVSVCLSGIDSVTQGDLMHTRLQAMLPQTFVDVVNDAFAVLSAGTMGKSGLAVIGGTGSIAVGERSDGAIARAGGYGSMLGDEGSGFDIGKQGLGAAVRSYEGRGPKTVLWDVLAKVYAVSHPLQLVDQLYEGEHQVTKVAAFAANVLEASSVDDVAKQIVRHAASSYIELIQAVRRQLNDDLGHRVVLAGGLFENYDVLQDDMKKVMPKDHLFTLARPPVLGALMRATEQGKRYNPELFRTDLTMSDWVDRLVIHTA